MYDLYLEFIRIVIFKDFFVILRCWCRSTHAPTDVATFFLSSCILFCHEAMSNQVYTCGLWHNYNLFVCPNEMKCESASTRLNNPWQWVVLDTVGISHQRIFMWIVIRFLFVFQEFQCVFDVDCNIMIAVYAIKYIRHWIFSCCFIHSFIQNADKIDTGSINHRFFFFDCGLNILYRRITISYYWTTIVVTGVLWPL